MLPLSSTPAYAKRGTRGVDKGARSTGKPDRRNKDLIRMHQERVRDLHATLERLENSQRALARELDFRSRAFVSRRADIIADIAQKRTELQERLKRLRDYLSLFERKGAIANTIADLEARQKE